MFRNILVPVDLADNNRRSLEIAVQMASRNNAQVTLLHVIETLTGADFEEFEDFYRELQKRSERSMMDIAAKYEEGPVSIKRVIRYGKRALEILRYAESFEVDLIVMNSHRIDPDNPGSGWGTISHRVGILSWCPVLLVK